ncbi:hypothetical protein Cni_G25537 [Canna indica]|uniref:Uncharacterized protein n=1 Tax=Canna indica TaxID=4628 RepID=A0AAQ3KXW4_9LILI|nr:hypothetical protein Cni_G25537 [Canna indica]
MSYQKMSINLNVEYDLPMSSRSREEQMDQMRSHITQLDASKREQVERVMSARQQEQLTLQQSMAQLMQQQAALQMTQNQQFMTAMKKDFEVMLNQRLDQLRHPQHISDDDCYRPRPMGDDDDQDDGQRGNNEFLDED